MSNSIPSAGTEAQTTAGAEITPSSPTCCNTPVVGSTVYLMDCVEGMKHYPDKYFDLVVVDPPYGIDIDKDKKNNFVITKHKSKFLTRHW